MHVINYIRTHFWVCIVLTFAFVFHMLMIMPSGTYLCWQGRCGIFFWGVHEHDSVWHLALSQVAFRTLPFQNPAYGGIALGGYNFLLDLILSIIKTITRIPIEVLFFKILPLFWFFFYSTAILKVSSKLLRSQLFQVILLIFLFFGSSFSWVFTVMKDKTIIGSSGILSMQAGQMLTNLQFACSLVTILISLYFISWPLRNEKKNSILLSILLFITLGLKFYAGIILLGLLGVDGIIRILKVIRNKNRSDIKYLFYNGFMLFCSFAIAVVIFYAPFSGKSNSGLVFSPFSIVHSIIEDPGLLNLNQVVLARYSLVASGLFSLRLIAIEVGTLLIFLFFNFGTRIIGLTSFLYVWKNKSNRRFWFFSTLGMLIGIICAVTFIQKGEWWNTIQFFYYSLFFASFFSAFVLWKIISHRTVTSLLLGIIIIIFTLFPNIDIVKGMVQFPATLYVPEEELVILRSFWNQPFDILFTSQQWKESQKPFPNTPPYPLSSSYHTSYRAAYSTLPEWIANPHILEVMGIDGSERRKRREQKDCSILEEVQYAYEVLAHNDAFFKQCIYKNSSWAIIKQNKVARAYEKISP